MTIRRFKKEKSVKSEKMTGRGRDAVLTCLFSTQRKILFPRKEEPFCTSPLLLPQIAVQPLRMGILRDPARAMTEDTIKGLLTPIELRRVYQQINNTLFGNRKDPTQTLECLIEREARMLYPGKVIFLLGDLPATKKHSALKIIGIDGVFWSPNWTIVPSEEVVFEEQEEDRVCRAKDKRVGATKGLKNFFKKFSKKA